jgi:hypothetical protein
VVCQFPGLSNDLIADGYYAMATSLGVGLPWLGWISASDMSTKTESNWLWSDYLRQDRRRQNDEHGSFDQVCKYGSKYGSVVHGEFVLKAPPRRRRRVWEKNAERTKAKWDQATSEDNVYSAKFWQKQLQEFGKGWHEWEGTNSDERAVAAATASAAAAESAAALRRCPVRRNTLRATGQGPCSNNMAVLPPRHATDESEPQTGLSLQNALELR